MDVGVEWGVEYRKHPRVRKLSNKGTKVNSVGHRDRRENTKFGDGES